MGGVIVDLGPIGELLIGADEPPDRLWARWLKCPAVRDFEMGLCDADEFGPRLVADLGLTITPEEALERFKAWPRGLFPDAAALVSSIPSGVETALLSNTNSLHWFSQTDHEAIHTLFPRAYLSFELQLAKPDPEMFDYVVADLGIGPRDILFIDDNQLNVDAARAVGITAERAVGTTETRSILEAHGLGV